MIENSIAFGENGGLIGTIVMPFISKPLHVETGFIFFNAGVVHRIGVHRTNVKLARQIASLGIPSIRFDLAGLGDSARAGGQHPFAEQAALDVRAAMDALGTATGVQRFVLFGACSGTVHSYAAALSDERIVGIAMFDSYMYPTAKSGFKRFVIRVTKNRSIVSFIKRAVAVSGRTFRHMFNYLRPSTDAKVAQPVRDIGFFAHRPSKAAFADCLNILLNRDVKILLIYAGSGLLHYNYAKQFSDAFKGFNIAHRVETAFLRDADHTATRLASQAELIACVEHWARRFAGSSQA
jgi:pimeloyl-ACP methyl ester carboxylesterase